MCVYIYIYIYLYIHIVAWSSEGGQPRRRAEAALDALGGRPLEIGANYY